MKRKTKLLTGSPCCGAPITEKAKLPVCTKCGRGLKTSDDNLREWEWRDDATLDSGVYRKLPARTDV